MRIGLFILSIFISLISFATHNRAGEISFKQIGVNQFEITLVTYTRIETEADRPIIEINWGDGSIDSLNRSPGFPQFVAIDINVNEYKSIHTFPGPGVYTVSLEDPNRNADVVNLPNSVNVPFYIESQIIINPFLGENTSPVLLNPPIEEACKNAVFQHNPSAFDADGDSLVYSLIEAKGLGGENVPGYTFPNGVSIDQKTGTLTWDKPTSNGEFNFAILIEEYRNGFLVGSMIRDMQVTVNDCDNNPPEIQAIKDICIEAGTNLNLTIKASDPDSGQAVTLTATGGPLSEVNGDLATFSEVVGIDSVSGQFKWQTGCEHVRLTPYQVFFKAQDNDSKVQLIDLHTLNITVIGPKVKNLTTEAKIEGIEVDWTRSICEEVVGYKVYRKSDSLNFEPDSCETGLPSYTGYELIETIMGRDSSSYFDKSVTDGNMYCYRIVAIFPDGAESIVSEESCAETIETSPIPLNADVINTDASNGEIFIRWKNPKDIDSLGLSDDAFYRIFEISFDMVTEIYTSTGLTDTVFTQTNINTLSSQHYYYIQLYDIVNNNEVFISSSARFKSVYLETSPADRQVNLKWNTSVPWNVDSSVILRDNNGTWEAIDTVNSTSYIDKELTNGIEYCYRILTLGEYSTNQSDTFLLNHSQEVCEIPEDIIPPCVPEINSKSECETDKNTFSWTIDSLDCNGDLTNISIYYKPHLNEDYSLLTTIKTPRTDTVFLHDNLLEVAGCYSFTATDSVGNQSELTNEVCFDNCPIYQLPNIFTPNGDALNELVNPFPYKYIESVQIEIYNRWGQIVYKADDIDVNWDGKHQLTKMKCSSGVYFYVATVNEQRLSGIESRIVNGFIHLIRD